ncbi:MAG TPA: type II toxin-antitoxin system RelE/ParE family toxin [Chthoniobacteraceae bacterium]|nr:type II toxin-antitoxin system RelE/ParE family toxin [Chthoniobacteraceae bacterium]
MQVRVFPIARERLLDIWQYTSEEWGDAQADDYVRGLMTAALALPTKRHLWRPVKERRLSGVYFFHHRHHYLFFKVLEEGALGILSILHENMNLPDRLRDDMEL